MARTYVLGSLKTPGIVALSLQALQVFILLLLLYIICIAFRRRLSRISRQSLNPFIFLGFAIIFRLLCITLRIVDSCLILTHVTVKLGYGYIYSCSNTFFVITKLLMYWSIILIFENRLGLLSISPNAYRTYKSWHRILMVVLVFISLGYIIYGFLLEAVYIGYLGNDGDNQLDRIQTITTQVNGVFLGFSSAYILEALYFCGMAFYMINKDVLTKSLRSILLTVTIFLFIHEAYYFAEAVILNLPTNDYTTKPIAIILSEVFNLSLLACITFLAYLLQPISQGLEDWELGTKYVDGPQPIETTTTTPQNSGSSYRQEQVQHTQFVEQQQRQQSLSLPPLPVQTRPTSPFYNQYQPNEPSPLKVVSTIPYSPHHSGEYSQYSSNRNSSILYHQQQLQVHITTPQTHTRHSSAYQESRTSMTSSRPWSWQSEGQFTVRPVPTTTNHTATTTTTSSPMMTMMARHVAYGGDRNINGSGDGSDNDGYLEHQDRRHSIVTAVPRSTWHYQVQEMTRPAQESTTIERWSGDQYA